MANERKASEAASEQTGEPRRDGVGRSRRPRRRTFFSIGEVCAMVGVKPHVLRYWESQFDELSPAKNRSGNRVYQTAEIELIALIHRLVHDERYTVAGARRRIAEIRAEGGAAAESSLALERVFLRTLESELSELHSLLDPSALSPKEGRE